MALRYGSGERQKSMNASMWSGFRNLRMRNLAVRCLQERGNAQAQISVPYATK